MSHGRVSQNAATPVCLRQPNTQQHRC